MFWSYDDVNRMLAGKSVHVLSNLSSTLFIRGENGDLHLRYWAANVVTYHPDQTFTLNTDGYTTKTTKNRLKEFGPVPVYSKGGTLFLDAPEGPVEFYDGIRVDAFGEPVDPSDYEEPDEYAAEMTVDNQINKTYL